MKTTVSGTLTGVGKERRIWTVPETVRSSVAETSTWGWKDEYELPAPPTPWPDNKQSSEVRNQPTAVEQYVTSLPLSQRPFHPFSPSPLFGFPSLARRLTASGAYHVFSARPRDMPKWTIWSVSATNEREEWGPETT